jgi:hypothetical protein
MDIETNNIRKTVAFATNYNNPSTSNNYRNNNYSTSSYQNNNSRTNFNNYNNFVNQVSTGNYVRPSVVNTTYNLSTSQVFENPSIISRNRSVVVKPDSLLKIEIFNPDLNGTRNRHISARLASFIRSLNTYRVGENTFDNSFVNGGVWAKPFQNRSGITVVINGVHVIESFPLTIFSEDPNWNHINEIKNYRKNFINTLTQISEFNYLKKFDL